MDTPAQERTYCSDISSQAGEALFASATTTNAFVLLEYNGAWGEKALEQSDLPESVKGFLSALNKGNSELKVLLLRRSRGEAASGYRLFVVMALPDRPAIHAFTLTSYEDMLSLNIPAMLAGDKRYQFYRHDGPLFLVCTNGRRDLCCSRKGIAVFESLAETLGERAMDHLWQCSHIGGHRFAANLICLPSGLLYGRVDADSARQILEYEQRQEIYLPNLRGRMPYSPPAQAADYFLRRQTGLARLDALQLQKVKELEPGRWMASIGEPHSRQVYSLTVRAEKPDIQVFDSCSLDKPASATHYVLEAIA